MTDSDHPPEGRIGALLDYTNRLAAMRAHLSGVTVLVAINLVATGFALALVGSSMMRVGGVMGGGLGRVKAPAMIHIIVVALAALSVVFPAYAVEMNVDDLKTLCTGGGEANKAACKFYILGVADGIGVANAATAHHETLCVPNSISSSTMTSAVEKSIGEDLMMFPDDKDLPAGSLVGVALVGRFPCGPHDSQ